MKDSEDRFQIKVKALVTDRGEIMIGRRDEGWQIIGGPLKHGEQVEEAIKRKIMDQTGLEVDIHQAVDVMTFSDEDEEDSLQIVFHCAADSHTAEALEDLEEVKWVKPDELAEEVKSEEADKLEDRDDQAQFLKKMQKMPSA